MSKRNVLQALCLVSEKAANIARAIRQEEHLLSLLVREKKDDEKNPRFLHDFKTLADVLVQEVVKHDLVKEFPELKDHIYGEESNEFSSLDGETVCLAVGSTESDTSSQLVQILGDERAAKSLAELVHSEPHLDIDIPACNVPTTDLGVWIDPIDSTAEYIAGGAVESSVAGVYSSGLPCVTVLIGAFYRSSGHPVLGVINQPFCQQSEDSWTGRIVWGICEEHAPLCSLPKHLSSTHAENVVLLSSSESSEVTSRLVVEGFTLLNVAGAGYKLLCVSAGVASAYVLSKPSTYYWDTCSAQAVLQACGGGMVDYSDAMTGDLHSLTYAGGRGTEECCNKGGFIAYKDIEVLKNIVNSLK